MKLSLICKKNMSINNVKEAHMKLEKIDGKICNLIMDVAVLNSIN
jgi:hypothetical protein